MHALVFQPDPLTVAELSYGYPLADRNDSSSSLFRSLMDTIKMKAQFSNDTIRLDDPSFQFGNFDPPFNPECYSLTDTLFFERDTCCFETVQAFYHLTHFRDYLNRLGDSTAGRTSVKVDIAGQSGADGSSYSDFNRLLSLGTGGVDDAEDPDVVIHEYGHSLLGDICPNTNQGLQRQALEEGTCDYLAAVWSSKFSSFNEYAIFNWDGHNEFWDGRKINTTATFPNDFVGNIYEDGEMWSTSLYAAGQEIGHDTLMIILLESMYQFFPNMTMPEGAELVLRTDSLLFNSRFSYSLQMAFYQQGLVEKKPTATKPLKNAKLKIYNSQAFHQGAPLLLQSTHPILSLKLYNLQGRPVPFRIHNNTPREVELSAPFLKPGVYILYIETPRGRRIKKLLR